MESIFTLKRQYALLLSTSICRDFANIPCHVPRLEWPSNSLCILVGSMAWVSCPTHGALSASMCFCYHLVCPQLSGETYLMFACLCSLLCHLSVVLIQLKSENSYAASSLLVLSSCTHLSSFAHDCIGIIYSKQT